MDNTNGAPKKNAIIMEGGAMRGMFTCGVIDVFMENGIDFDGACGISAGAVFGCNIKSHQIGRAIRYNKKYSKDPRYCSFRSLIKTGDLYGAEFCYETLPNELDPFDTKTFEESPMEFYVGATDVNTGKIVFYKCTDGGPHDIEWMRASASMPLVSSIVKIDGYELLDGGISCPVPYKHMEKMGYEKNVIVLTQPAGYVKPKSRIAPLMRVALRKYPKVAERVRIRHVLYNRQMEDIRKREEQGAALIIRPEESLGVGRTEKDPAELERVYQMGRREAEKRLEDVRAFLAE